jgi:hypothetical protein
MEAESFPINEEKLTFFKLIKGVRTKSDQDMEKAELKAYVDRARENAGEKNVYEMWFHVDGDFVDIKTIYKPQPFQRIRRITGYLVGTLDRFNDGKAAEERERVKHSV